MEKRGQFYLMAAIIISFILFSLISISTYIIVNPKPQTIDDISSDLNRESYNLIEYGIYNKENLQELLTKFTSDDVGEYYLKKTGDNSNIIFVYGNREGISALQYNRKISGTISLGSASWNNINSYAKIKKIAKNELVGKDTIDIEFLDNTYTFDISENEIFYFVAANQQCDFL